MRVTTRIFVSTAALGLGALALTGCTQDEIAAWKAFKAQEQANASASPAPTASEQVQTLGERAVAAGETMLGAPYVWGGQSPAASTAADSSSGPTAGRLLPAWRLVQPDQLRHPVSASELQLGDLVFYGPGGSQHVAMYYGNGKVIEAGNPATGVHIAGIYYTGTPTAYRRIS